MPSHPVMHYRVQNLISRYSLAKLLLVYVLFTGILSFICSIPYWSLTVHNFAKWWLLTYQSLYSFGPPNDIAAAPDTVWRSIFDIVTTTASVLAPSILLGVVVYKFFNVSRAVSFRSTAHLNLADANSPEMVVRFYNSTPFPLTDVKATLYIRVREMGQVSLNVYNLHLVTKPWVYGPPGVPFTIRAPLEAADISEVDGTSELTFFGGHALDHKDWDVVAMVSGTAPNLNTDFMITKIYKKTEITQLTPGQVDIQDNNQPRSWTGWDNFD